MKKLTLSQYLAPSTLALVLLLPAALQAQDFDTSTHTAPNPQNAARTSAQQALDARDFPKAIKLLTPLAEASPHDAQLLYDLASAQDAVASTPDQTTAAETTYKQSIAADPTLLEPHLALGLLYARANRMDLAREQLLAASTSPGDPLLKARAFRSLARIDQSTRPEAARENLLAALKLSPETPEDTVLAAELATASGTNTPAAEASLRKLLATHPNDPEASAALARILLQQNRIADAETILRSALEANPSEPILTTQLVTALNAEGKPAEALPLVETLHKAHPEDPNVTHLLARLEAQTSNYAAAEPLYAALATQAPQDLTLAVAHADTLIHLKHYAEAQQLLTPLMAQPDRFPTPAELGETAARLAFAASENNDPQAALQALAVRATVLPSSPATLFLQAISEDKLHRIKQAQQAYREFLKVANGTLPDQEFEAKHRLIALEHRH